MTTRRGFLGLLGVAAAAPVALAAAKLLPKQEHSASQLIQGKIPTPEDLKVEYIHDPVLEEAMQRMAEQAAYTRDQIYWNVLNYGDWIPISG